MAGFKQATNTLISDEVLSGSISFGTLALIYLGGNVTAFSPCSLSMLPITVGYISAFSTEQDARDDGDGDGDSVQDGTAQRDQRQSTSTLVLSSAFAAGLATTLAALGFTAATAGKAYGQVTISTRRRGERGRHTRCGRLLILMMCCALVTIRLATGCLSLRHYSQW